MHAVYAVIQINRACDEYKQNISHDKQYCFSAFLLPIPVDVYGSINFGADPCNELCG